MRIGRPVSFCSRADARDQVGGDEVRGRLTNHGNCGTTACDGGGLGGDSPRFAASTRR
jgi:hypothetical protein